MMRFVWRVVRVLLGLAFLLVLAGAGGLWLAVREIERGLPDLRKLEDYEPFLTSRVYDRAGRPIGEFYEERRQVVPIDEIPEIVRLAFVAGEDDTFFEHGGIDYESIARAAWVNFRAGGKVKQGGSTITQQVAKSLLSSERSYLRKAKDMLLAKRIEERFTKDEILFLYLNQIYLGHGAYGVGEASWTYFGKPLKELSVGEAALIAGLPKAPTDYSPFNAPAAAEQRRQYVLQRMLDERFIDHATWEKASTTPPRFSPPPEHADYRTASYFTEEVRRTLYERLGRETVLRDGLRIETTLDLDLERTAVTAVRRGLEAYDRRHGGWRGPLRRVAPEAFPAELAALARDNELVRANPEQHVPLELERNYTGVVADVDPRAGEALVRLSPEIELPLGFADAEWAARGTSSLGALLHVGDVARFRLRPAAEGEDGPHLVLTQDPTVEGALVSLDADTASVVALVGGYDFSRSEFDRATQARRQPGSAFKPFVYGAALEDGYAPTSIIVDTPVVVVDPGSGELWKPENYTKRFYGAVTAREALARSLNNATVRLYMDVGIDKTIAFARKLGIRSPLGRHLSLALGSTEVSLLELTGAYETVAAGGVRRPPVFIKRVLDRHGKVLLENVPLGDVSLEGSAPYGAPVTQTASVGAPPSAGPEEGVQVIPKATAFMMTSMLRAVVEEPYGTAHKAASRLQRPIAGKTGTTNDQKDAWFVGFSPEIATGVWIGHDSREVLGDKETGGHAALPIWMDFMETALADRPVRDFEAPEGILFARVSRSTGRFTSADDPSSIFLPFLDGAKPRNMRMPDAAEPAEGDDSYDPLRDGAF